MQIEEKKVAIVTGGATGIGKEIVKTLAQQEYKVIINYFHSKVAAEELQKELTQKEYNVEIFQADITKKEEVKKLVQYVLKENKKIDLLVNNAGITQFKLFTEITEEEWEIMLHTNLTSAFYMTQAVVLGMIQKKQGNIINISSIWGMIGASCEVHYSVAKAGLDAMTKSLAKELRAIWNKDK